MAMRVPDKAGNLCAFLQYTTKRVEWFKMSFSAFNNFPFPPKMEGNEQHFFSPALPFTKAADHLGWAMLASAKTSVLHLCFMSSLFLVRPFDIACGHRDLTSAYCVKGEQCLMLPTAYYFFHLWDIKGTSETENPSAKMNSYSCWNRIIKKSKLSFKYCVIKW